MTKARARIDTTYTSAPPPPLHPCAHLNHLRACLHNLPEQNMHHPPGEQTPRDPDQALLGWYAGMLTKRTRMMALNTVLCMWLQCAQRNAGCEYLFFLARSIWSWQGNLLAVLLAGKKPVRISTHCGFKPQNNREKRSFSHVGCRFGTVWIRFMLPDPDSFISSYRQTFIKSYTKFKNGELWNLAFLTILNGDPNYKLYTLCCINIFKKNLIHI